MTTLHITGMKCQHCVKAVTKALENLGVTEVRVDLEKEQASFQGAIDKEAARTAITKQGFTLVD